MAALNQEAGKAAGGDGEAPLGAAPAPPPETLFDAPAAAPAAAAKGAEAAPPAPAEGAAEGAPAVDPPPAPEVPVWPEGTKPPVATGKGTALGRKRKAADAAKGDADDEPEPTIADSRRAKLAARPAASKASKAAPSK